MPWQTADRISMFGTEGLVAETKICSVKTTITTARTKIASYPRL